MKISTINCLLVSYTSCTTSYVAKLWVWKSSLYTSTPKASKDVFQNTSEILYSSSNQLGIGNTFFSVLSLSYLMADFKSLSQLMSLKHFNLWDSSLYLETLFSFGFRPPSLLIPSLTRLSPFPFRVPLLFPFLRFSFSMLFSFIQRTFVKHLLCILQREISEVFRSTYNEGTILKTMAYNSEESV